MRLPHVTEGAFSLRLTSRVLDNNGRHRASDLEWQLHEQFSTCFQTPAGEATFADALAASCATLTSPSACPRWGTESVWDTTCFQIDFPAPEYTAIKSHVAAVWLPVVP